jgi:hypothetical protein
MFKMNPLHLPEPLFNSSITNTSPATPTFSDVSANGFIPRLGSISPSPIESIRSIDASMRSSTSIQAISIDSASIEANSSNSEPDNLQDELSRLGSPSVGPVISDNNEVNRVIERVVAGIPRARFTVNGYLLPLALTTDVIGTIELWSRTVNQKMITFPKICEMAREKDSFIR